MLMMKWINKLMLKCRDIDDDVDSDVGGEIGSGNDEAIYLEVANGVNHYNNRSFVKYVKN